MRLDVIGLAGRAGSGKNYIADTYFAPLGYRSVALADHMKMHLVGTGQLTYREAFHEKTERSRTMLQTDGMALRAKYGIAAWASILWTWCERWAETWGETKFVVTDIRFPDEIDYLHAREALVYGIDAPERVAAYAQRMSPDQQTHVSETSLVDAARLYDAVISNDPHDATTVGIQIRGFLHAHRYARYSDVRP